MWDELRPLGRDPQTGGYRRFAWTRVDATLREWFSAECARRGLDVTLDRAGNQWAWWGDPDAAAAVGNPGVVVGSHLDSVPDGGAFDGPLGVVSALAAIDELRARQVRPNRPIGVVNFIDEEGARFGIACAGSRLITGALSAERALELTDIDGISMAQALTAAGRKPEQLGVDPQALARVGTFVELHIEQGRGLVDLGAPVAVARDIWPHGRWRIDIPGEANHAGTTRIVDRRDAMLGCAGVVLAARAAAVRHNTVATVGKVRIDPGGVNAIAGHVTCWLDSRGPEESSVRATLADVEADGAQAGVTVTEESWTPTTLFDPVLRQRLVRVLGGAPVLGTGAGHDAGILANAGVATAMLFVRNPTGVSHSPAEYAEEQDCLRGVTALADVLADLSRDTAAQGTSVPAGGPR
jgi:N-carbamoyl-L-amino-acid hydrolase